MFSASAGEREHFRQHGVARELKDDPDTAFVDRGPLSSPVSSARA